MTKICPFCAEEIQTNAIVCKHCQRDLATPPAAPRKKSKPRWGKILGVVGLFFAGLFALAYFSTDHQDYLAFSEKRTQWHMKCDAYLNTPLTDRNAKACNDELQEMMAYAKRQGW